MVKYILLRMDEAMFNKMIDDKHRREREQRCIISWEEYVKLLFGLSRYIK